MVPEPSPNRWQTGFQRLWEFTGTDSRRESQEPPGRSESLQLGPGGGFAGIARISSGSMGHAETAAFGGLRALPFRSADRLPRARGAPATRCRETGGSTGWALSPL